VRETQRLEAVRAADRVQLHEHLALELVRRGDRARRLAGRVRTGDTDAQQDDDGEENRSV